MTWEVPDRTEDHCPEGACSCGRDLSLDSMQDAGILPDFAGRMQSTSPVAARLARQSIFDRPHPPNLWIVLDEIVLDRLIGTPKTVYDHCSR
jgi:hypothetical protein